jgi:HicB family
MTETVTVRLPKGVHQKAKLAATRTGMSLQDWISSVATKAIKEGGEDIEPGVPFARQYHNLPPNLKRSVQDFVELLTLASRDHIRNLEQHITGLVRILRRCDPKFLREFEKS